jgi:hypothetical protein
MSFFKSHARANFAHDRPLPALGRNSDGALLMSAFSGKADIFDPKRTLARWSF